MKCEYCDNEVPVGAARCPCCGGPVSQRVDESKGIPSLNNAAVVSSPVTPSNNFAATYTHKGKNKWVFILLGVFLGELGVHNFYTGYIVRGVVKVLITVLSFGMLFGISWIWAIVEVCTVRIDAAGYPFES